ncbi:MAG TPA: alpha-E domain-containing protein, partial [Planctomycetaceae bacterium]|nr:alpha-E domain-containing protein [Planctomycetaceae bacterium]
FDNLQQNAVLDLCLTDDTCPRSLVVQLASLVEHVDALPGDDGSLLRSEEKRTVMAMLHSVRMIAPEELEQPASATLLQRLSDVEQQSQTLANVLSRKYLLHSGIPRQITSEVELPQ